MKVKVWSLCCDQILGWGELRLSRGWWGGAWGAGSALSCHLGHLTSGLARVYMQDTVCTTAATLLQIRHCINIKKIYLTLVLSPIRKNRITCMTKHHKDHEIFTHYSMGEAKRLDTHLVKTKLADGQFN